MGAEVLEAKTVISFYTSSRPFSGWRGSCPNNTDIFDSSGAPTGVAGLLTSTTTTAREIQFALKVTW